MIRKIALAIVGTVIVLSILGIIAPHFISDSTFKGPLIAKLQAMTGRTLTIDGAFKLKMFPSAGVHMDNVTLSNPQGSTDTTPFMTLSSLKVEVSVLPLLGGRIKIKELVLTDPHINLHVGKDGRNNWEMTPYADASEPREPKKKRARANAGPVAVLPSDVLLSDVAIKNGSVLYTNDVTGKRWDIKNLDSEVSLDGISSPFTAEGQGEWNGKKVKTKAKFDSLQSFFAKQRTNVEASLGSDLLSLDIKGDIDKGAFYTGNVAIQSSSLNELMAWADPSAKKPASPARLALDIKSDAECSLNSCNLTNLTLALDDLKATGSIKAELTDNRPNLDIRLTTNMLDVNAFLPQQQADSGNILISDAMAASGWSTQPIDFSPLRSMDALLDIKTGGIKVNNITIGKTVLHAKLMHSRLNMEMLDAEMYSGKGTVTLGVDASAGMPALESRIALKNVQLEPLLKDVNGGERFSGAANLDVNLASRGNSEKDIVAALVGRGQAKVADGTLKGVNIADMVKNLPSAFTGGGGQKTVFSNMAGSFLIAQGVMTNDDLVMTAPTLNVTGKGKIDLPMQTIDYRLTPQMIRASDNPAAGPKSGLSVPVIVEGSLDNPKYRPDVGTVLQDALKDPKQFKEQLKNSENSLKDQIKSPKDAVKNLKNLLKGF